MGEGNSNCGVCGINRPCVFIVVGNRDDNGLFINSLANQMIDPTVLARNLKDCISQFPVKARHKNRTMDVKLNSTQDIIQTLDAATRDNMTVSVIGTKDGFGRIPPKSMDDFDILINDKWVRFQIRDVPDFFDPLSPGYTINLQSPQKGIE